MANGYEVITSGTFDGTSASVDLTSIPATYSHLEISCTTNSNQAGYRASWMLTINGDTASNYGYLGVAQGSGYGNPAYSSNDTSTAPVTMGYGPGADAGSGSGGDMVGSWNLWFWKLRGARIFIKPSMPVLVRIRWSLGDDGAGWNLAQHRSYQPNQIRGVR